MDAAAFVGRVAELEQLRGSLAAAAGRSTAVHLVEGEPGIGKTRILAELARHAPGWQVYWGRCHEGGGAPPFCRGRRRSRRTSSGTARPR